MDILPVLVTGRKYQGASWKSKRTEWAMAACEQPGNCVRAYLAVGRGVLIVGRWGERSIVLLVLAAIKPGIVRQVIESLTQH